MYGRSTTHDYRLDARDKKMAKVKSALQLAIIRAQKTEVTRLTKQLKRLGQSL